MQRHYHVAKTLSRLLDTQFKVGNFSVGLDPLLNFIPGLGDIIALILSLYIIWIARQFNVPEKDLALMIRNVVFDFILGLIPVLGFIGDFIYKANVKNLKILEKYVSQPILEGEIISEEK